MLPLRIINQRKPVLNHFTKLIHHLFSSPLYSVIAFKNDLLHQYIKKMIKYQNEGL